MEEVSCRPLKLGLSCSTDFPATFFFFWPCCLANVVQNARKRVRELGEEEDGEGARDVERQVDDGARNPVVDERVETLVAMGFGRDVVEAVVRGMGPESTLDECVTNLLLIMASPVRRGENGGFAARGQEQEEEEDEDDAAARPYEAGEDDDGNGDDGSQINSSSSSSSEDEGAEEPRAQSACELCSLALSVQCALCGAQACAQHAQSCAGCRRLWCKRCGEINIKSARFCQLCSAEKDAQLELLHSALRFDMCAALPCDIIWILCNYLTAGDLYKACLVSKEWLELFGNDTLWAHRFTKDFACCDSFAGFGPMRLKQDGGLPLMSFFAFRTKMEVLCSRKSVEPAVLVRRGRSCDVGLQDMARLTQMMDAEESNDCFDCCPSVRFLTPLAQVVAEQMQWPHRAAPYLENASPEMRRMIESMRYLKSERKECRFQETDFSRTFHFAFLLLGKQVVCRFFESDSEEDTDFPQFTLIDASNTDSVSFSLYPEDIWSGEHEIHPLKLFESVRSMHRIPKAHVPDILEFLLLAVRRSGYIGDRRGLVYADVECGECGNIHL